MKPINTHPFAVEAHFETSVVLTYALPLPPLERLVAPAFELDTYRGMGFLAVAFVKVNSLRPKGLPRWLGQRFILAGYRLFVRHTGADHRRRRGLQILRSETNRQRMVLLGNLFTRYHYQKRTISWQEEDHCCEIRHSDGLLVHTQENGEVQLPGQSPFPDWRTARRYAGPMPFTFSYQPSLHAVTTVEGVRPHWNPKAVWVDQAEIPFLDEMDLPEAQLASAFVVRDLSYRWKAGITEPCATIS